MAIGSSTSLTTDLCYFEYIISSAMLALSRVFFCQNLVKRDKDGYKDEFLQQQRNYLSELEIFKLKVIPIEMSP